jgi:hypothetical protein
VRHRRIRPRIEARLRPDAVPVETGFSAPIDDVVVGRELRPDDSGEELFPPTALNEIWQEPPPTRRIHIFVTFTNRELSNLVERSAIFQQEVSDTFP